VRFSWKTCVNVIESKKALVDWRDPNPNAPEVKNQQKLAIVPSEKRKANVAVKKLNISRKVQI
jgi:hypothetical protein